MDFRSLSALAAELAPDVNAVLAAVGQLQQLQSFELNLLTHPWHDQISLAPLARLPLLRRFSLQGPSNPDHLTQAQVAELRALEHVEDATVFPMNTALLGRLLAPPHTLRWKALSDSAPITEAVAPLLPALPLETLRLWLAVPHADFLQQTLRTVRGTQLDSARILRAVASCTQLRSIRLTDSNGITGLHVTSEQLTACLSQLPHLAELVLHCATALTTLAFLTSGSLPHTLTGLYLDDFYQQLPLCELQHVHSLSALRHLSLTCVFDAPLSPADVAALTPPTQSPTLRHLTTFQHKWSAPRRD